MSDVVDRYLVAHDVVSDARRGRVAKTIEPYETTCSTASSSSTRRPRGSCGCTHAFIGLLVVSEGTLLICDLGPLLVTRQRRIEFIEARRAIIGGDPLVVWAPLATLPRTLRRRKPTRTPRAPFTQVRAGAA